MHHGARVRLHQGTTEVLARVSIVAPPDEGTTPRSSSRAAVASPGCGSSRPPR